MRMMEAYRINQIKSVCDFIGIADSFFFKPVPEKP